MLFSYKILTEIIYARNNTVLLFIGLIVYYEKS